MTWSNPGHFATTTGFVILFLCMISRIADVRALRLELISRVHQGFLCAVAVVAAMAPERSLIEEMTEFV
jgi:hypothetical protein